MADARTCIGHIRVRLEVTARRDGRRCDTDDVGYNPYRKFTAKPADYVLVAICILLAAGLVAWAFLG